MANNLHLTAKEAYALAEQRQRARNADEINYNLTIKRVMNEIKDAAENGKTHLAWVAPEYVLDGTSTDPILLARQVRVRLSELGYHARRDGATVFIDWDLELRRTIEEQATNKEKKRKPHRDPTLAEIGMASSPKSKSNVRVQVRKRNK